MKNKISQMKNMKKRIFLRKNAEKTAFLFKMAIGSRSEIFKQNGNWEPLRNVLTKWQLGAAPKCSNKTAIGSHFQKNAEKTAFFLRKI